MATDKNNQQMMKHGNLEVLEKDYKIAYDFSFKIQKKFKNLVKSVILFGSVAKREAKPTSDIDLVILVDDASIKWDREAIAWYQEELKKIVNRESDGDRLHINTVTLSSFWENVLIGEPAAINILRYGIPVLDPGFIMPLKFLLYQGRVRPSQEAVYNCAGRVPWHIFRGKIKLLGAIGDFYWAFVDSAHAPLMQAGYVPPSPEHVAELLDKVFVAHKKIDGKYAVWMREIYELAHRIKNNEVPSLPGRVYDLWLKRTEEFTQAMAKLLQTEKPTHKHYRMP